MTTSHIQQLVTSRLIMSAFVTLLMFPMYSHAQAQALPLADLSAFKQPGSSWKIVGNVQAEFGKENKLATSPGTGILVNLADKKGTDLYTQAEYGDLDLELDFMMAFGSNSGIYLQGRYELQLMDSWTQQTVSQGGNGAVYQRWNDNAPEGQQGYEGHAPRMNASRAPGTWQKLRVSFQAPRFDGSGKKIANAKMLRVQLNGVTIHENLQLSGPTRGSFDAREAATGPLRIQGDHGSLAIRNIKITTFPAGSERPTVLKDPAEQKEDWSADPIMLRADENKILRSFVDIPKVGRLTHTISVGSPMKVHYTYDANTGSLAQIWRGDFIDATPMWHERGDGSSRPAGAVQYFGNVVPAIAKLDQQTAPWPKDTVNSGIRPKGYTLDNNDLPTFRYLLNGMKVEDKTRVTENRQGLSREITVSNPQPNLYFRAAAGSSIEKLDDGLYLIDDKSYYLQIDKSAGAIIRDGADGGKEIIIPVKNRIAYSILF